MTCRGLLKDRHFSLEPFDRPGCYLRMGVLLMARRCLSTLSFFIIKCHVSILTMYRT